MLQLGQRHQTVYYAKNFERAKLLNTKMKEKSFCLNFWRTIPDLIFFENKQNISIVRNGTKIACIWKMKLDSKVLLNGWTSKIVLFYLLDHKMNLVLDYSWIQENAVVDLISLAWVVESVKTNLWMPEIKNKIKKTRDNNILRQSTTMNHMKVHQ